MKHGTHSMPHRGGSKKHHSGHPHGHPTQHGLGGADSGTMAEHGLSEGNCHKLKSALPVSSLESSVLHEHELQHVDYASIVGEGAYTGGHKD